MPVAVVSAGKNDIPLEFHWWGDELTTRRVRGTCRIEGAIDKEFLVQSGDARLVPLSVELFHAPLPVVTPLPLAMPAALQSIHPRILLRAEDLPRLRSAADAERKESLDRVQALLARWELPLRKTAESKIPPGPEGLAGEDRLLVGAYLALLFPTEENRRRACDAYMTYLRLTASPGFEPLTIDTQAGEVLFLLAVGYDWLHDCLAPAEREEADRWLNEVADICWSHLGYQRRDFAQAHFLGCGLGLLTYSLLFYGTHPRAKEWAGYLQGVALHVCTTLSPDGFFPHGLNMWIYETGFLLRWLEVLRTAADCNLWPHARALAASSRFRAAATSPDGMVGLTMGDPQYRVGGDSWCHTLIASRTGARTSRWLGNFLRDLSVDGVDFRLAPARRRVYEHLWLDANVPPEEPHDRVTIFPDGGQAFVRTDRSLFTFRSGSPLGTHRYASGITGAYGHADPCNGSFLLYDRGAHVLSGPGAVYRRDTALHNTITIDGQGQIGDSAVWLPDFFPPDTMPPPAEFRSEGKTLAASADLGPGYLRHLGVVRMQRSLLFRPERFVVGVDTVELDADRSIEWNLHTVGEFLRSPFRSGSDWTVLAGGRSALTVSFLAPQPVDWTTGKTEFVPAYPHDGTRDHWLRGACRGANARFVWVMLLEGEPGFTPLMTGEALVRLADGSTVTFDGRWIQCRTGHETGS